MIYALYVNYQKKKDINHLFFHSSFSSPLRGYLSSFLNMPLSTSNTQELIKWIPKQKKKERERINFNPHPQDYFNLLCLMDNLEEKKQYNFPATTYNSC